jgi:(R,R)-butanediol dehydrogenase / meso-butanediol dehydrogenase / diacetyl reductase
MRAAALSEAGGFEVVQLDDPTPGSGELVLRVQACGICGSDLKSYRRFPTGAVLGHEFCGEVVAVGSGVERWRTGQHAAALPLRSCGRCRWCLDGEPAHCEVVDLLGLGTHRGAFAEYVRVAAVTTVPLGRELGVYGALVEPFAVGLHTVAAAGLRPGERVLIIGAGNVGAAVATWARRLGAGEIVMSDSSPARRADATVFGATASHDPGDGPPEGSFDVVFECVGVPGLVQSAIDAAALHGRVVVAGVCVVPDQIGHVAAIMKEVQVRYAVYYRTEEFAAAAALLESGAVDPADFVTRTVALGAVGEAFDDLQSGFDDRKVLVNPTS